jgi:CO dehydrogenase/acetyl-CoA synthase gamma subunit (corrinoid Fe-S protein)
MIPADLYLHTINFLKYLPKTDCKECGEPTCAAFVKKLKDKARKPSECPFLHDKQVRVFQLVLQAAGLLPEVPALDVPRPSTAGLMQINQADKNSLILLSGNSEFTQEVLSSIMAFTLSPFWLLFADCRGDTVDMAMIYRSLKIENIIAVLEETDLRHQQQRRAIVIPGFASTLKDPLEQRIGWQVKVGPICVAELPLFLGEEWELPSDITLG